ncbi:MAG: hypothetical protein ACOX89_08835 [Lutispora sp.]|jgi:hypothetical protein
MPANSGRFQCVPTDDAVRLIADELGIDIQELERKRQAKIEAEAQEKIRRQCEAEEETRRRQKEAREAELESAIVSGRVLAWVATSAGKTTKVRHLADLRCPECGEVPDLLANVLGAFHRALPAPGCDERWFENGTMTVARHVRKMPAFNITVTCSCGAEAVYTAVCLPKG